MITQQNVLLNQLDFRNSKINARIGTNNSCNYFAYNKKDSSFFEFKLVFFLISFLSRNQKRSYMHDNHHHHSHHQSRDGSGYSRNNYHHHYNHNQIPFNHLQQHQPHSDQYGMSHQSYPVIQSSLPYQSNSYSSSLSHKKHRNRSSCNYFFLFLEIF